LFRRQFSIGNYVLDFYCPQKRLAIELDGSQHNDPENQKNDKYRTSIIQDFDITVLRFWNFQVFDDMQNVLDIIHRQLVSLP